MNFNATLIGQTFAFVVFVWFTMKFVWPLLLKQMHDRETRIADGLAAADKGQKALEEAAVRHGELVEEGKQHAAEIISQAQRRGDEIVDESKSNAKSEGQRLIHAAEAEIEREKTQAREDLRKEVATLALVGVEQILMREINPDAHNEIITKLSSEL